MKVPQHACVTIDYEKLTSKAKAQVEDSNKFSINKEEIPNLQYNLAEIKRSEKNNKLYRILRTMRRDPETAPDTNIDRYLRTMKRDPEAVSDTNIINRYLRTMKRGVETVPNTNNRNIPTKKVKAVLLRMV